MAHVIAVAGKGGVGKTTLCGMLIQYLLREGQRSYPCSRCGCKFQSERSSWSEGRDDTWRCKGRDRPVQRLAKVRTRSRPECPRLTTPR